MSNIDERILEMKFDNHLFDKNIETSIKSLEKLKTSMDFSGVTNSLNGIEKSVNSMDFSGAERSLEVLRNRFSVTGEWIHNKLYSIFDSAWNKITALPRKSLGLIENGGWNRALNVAQAKFQIEGLGQSWKDLYGVIDEAVTGTQFGFDEAAKVAAQLSASGLKAGEGMDKALNGIAGVAAMANTSYEDIGRIYTTVAGNGRLMGDQLMQFSVRGLNVAAELGHVLNKTEAEIRDMVSKGQIDFRTFSDAMDMAFSEHAHDADKTFTGSMQNMQAALKRMGQPFAESIQNSAIPLFVKLKEVIKTVSSQMKPLTDAFDWFMKGLTGAGVKILSSLKLDFFSGIFSKIGSAFQWLGDILNGFAGVVEPVKDAVDGVTKAVEPFLVTADEINEVANRIMKGDFGNGAENRFKAIQEELGWSEDAAKAAQNVVNEMMGSTFRYDVAADKMTKSVEGEGEALKKTGQLGNSYVAAHEKMKGTAKLVGDSFKDMFKSIDKAEVLSKLGTFVRGLGSGLAVFAGIVQSVVKGALSHLIDMLKSVGGFLLNAGEALGNWLTNLRAWVEESGALGKIQNFTSKAFGHVSNAVKTGLNVTSVGLKFIGTGLSKLKDGIVAGKEKIVEFFASFKNTEAYSRLFSVFQSIKDKFIEIKDNVIQKVMDLLDKFTGAKIKMPKIDMGNFAEKVSNKIVWLMDKVGALRDKLVSLFNEKVVGDWKIPEKLEGIKNAIMSVFTASTFEKIKGAFGSVVDTIGKFKDKIVSFFQDTVIGDWGLLDKLESIKDRITGLFSSDAFSSVKEFFTNIGNWFKNIFGGSNSQAAEKGLDTVETVVTKFDGVASKASHVTQSFTAVKDSVASITGTADDIAEKAKSIKAKIPLIDKLKDFGATAKTALEKAAKSVKGSLKDAGALGKFFSGIFETIHSVASFVASYIVGPLGNLIGVIVKTVADLLSGIIPVIGGFVSRVTEFMFSGGLAKFIATVQSLMGLGLAASITRFANSIANVIGSVNKVISGIAGIEKKIGGVLSAVKKIGKATSRVMNAASILILAAAIGVLAIAFKALGSMSWEQFKVAAAAILVITGALSVLFAVIGHFQAKKAGNSIPQSALTPLFNVLDYLKDSIAKFLKKLGKAAMILAFVVAVKTLIGAVRSIGEMDPASAAKGLTGLGVLMAEFVAAMGALNLAMLPGGKAKFGSMIGQTVKMLGFALVIKMLAKSVASLGAIDEASLLKGTTTVKALALSLDGMMVASHFMKSGKGTLGAFVGMAAIVATLALSLKALSKINGKSLRNATLALSAVEGVTAGLTYMMSGFATVSDSKQKLMSMISIVAIVGTLAFALYKLSSINPTALAAAGLALGAIIGATALLASGLAKLSDTGSIGDKFASVATLLITIGGLLAEIEVAAWAMQEFNIDPGIMAGLILNFTLFSAGLNILVEGLVKWSEIPGGAGDKFVDAMSFLGTGTVYFAAFTGITALCGWIDDISNGGFMELLDSGKQILGKIAETIGYIVGELIGGIVDGFVKGVFGDSKGSQADVDKFKSDFAGLMGSIKEMMSGDGIDTGKAEALKTVMITLLAAFGADILGALLDAIGGLVGHQMFDSLKDHLEKLADALVTYSQKMGGFEIDNVANSDAAATMVLNLAKAVPATGGVLQDLIGEINPDEFGDKLGAFADGLVTYSQKMAGFESDNVNKSDQAAGMVLTLAKSVPESGGTLQDLIGEIDPALFGGKLEAFADGLVKYSQTIGNFETGNVEKADEASNMVMALAKSVPKSRSGWLGNLFGNVEPGEFGDKLVPFAEGLCAYSEKIGEFKSENVTKADQASQMIMALATSVPEDPGIIGWIVGGDLDLTGFADEMVDFAEGLVSFAETVGGIEGSQVKDVANAVDMVTALLDFSNMIADNEGDLIAGFESPGQEAFKSFGYFLGNVVTGMGEALSESGAEEQLKELGSSLKDAVFLGFTESTDEDSTLGAQIAQKLTETLSDSKSIKPEDVSGLTTAIGEALKSAFTDEKYDVKGSAESIIKDAFSAMTQQTDSSGATLITKVGEILKLIKDVLSSYTNSFYNAMSNSLSGALRAGYDYVGRFKQMGRDLMTGLAEGISANGQAAINNARNVANAINTTVANIHQIKSPSRVFRSYGRYLMLGLGMGIKENADYAVNNAATAAVGVVDITKEQLSEKNLREITGTLLAAYLYINQAINDAMDTNPVITPIVDLSQVQNGLNSMGGLFGGSSMSYARNMYPYSYANGSVQQAGRDSVAAQLDGIRSDIRMLGEAMTGMQMVLDSGVVVGQLGNGIDQRLGDIQKVKERWG